MIKKKIIFLCLLLSINTMCIGTEQNKKKSKRYTDMYNKTVDFYNSFFIPNSILAGNIENTKKSFTSIALASLNKKELRILRNMFYAKYGKIFSSKDLSDYYENFFDWYEPEYQNVDEKFDMVEIENIKKIELFEKGYSISKNILKDDYIGTWIDFNSDDYTGTLQRYIIRSDNTITYYCSDGKDNFESFYGYEGTYTIENGFLIIQIKKILYHDFSYLYSQYSDINGYSFSDIEDMYFTPSKPIELRFPLSDSEFDKHGENCFKIGFEEYYFNYFPNSYK